MSHLTLLSHKSDVSHYPCSSPQFQLIDIIHQVNFGMSGWVGKYVLHNAIINELCFVILIRKLGIQPNLCQINRTFWNIRIFRIVWKRVTTKLNLNTHLFVQILKWAFFVLIVDSHHRISCFSCDITLRN